VNANDKKKENEVKRRMRWRKLRKENGEDGDELDEFEEVEEKSEKGERVGLREFLRYCGEGGYWDLMTWFVDGVIGELEGRSAETIQAKKGLREKEEEKKVKQGCIDFVIGAMSKKKSDVLRQCFRLSESSRIWKPYIGRDRTKGLLKVASGLYGSVSTFFWRNRSLPLCFLEVVFELGRTADASFILWVLEKVYVASSPDSLKALILGAAAGGSVDIVTAIAANQIPIPFECINLAAAYDQVAFLREIHAILMRGDKDASALESDEAVEVESLEWGSPSHLDLFPADLTENRSVNLASVAALAFEYGSFAVLDELPQLFPNSSDLTYQDQEHLCKRLGSQVVNGGLPVLRWVRNKFPGVIHSIMCSGVVNHTRFDDFIAFLRELSPKARRLICADSEFEDVFIIVLQRKLREKDRLRFLPLLRMMGEERAAYDLPPRRQPPLHQAPFLSAHRRHRRDIYSTSPNLLSCFPSYVSALPIAARFYVSETFPISLTLDQFIGLIKIVDLEEFKDIIALGKVRVVFTFSSTSTSTYSFSTSSPSTSSPFRSGTESVYMAVLSSKPIAEILDWIDLLCRFECFRDLSISRDLFGALLDEETFKDLTVFQLHAMWTAALDIGIPPPSMETILRCSMNQKENEVKGNEIENGGRGRSEEVKVREKVLSSRFWEAFLLWVLKPENLTKIPPASTTVSSSSSSSSLSTASSTVPQSALSDPRVAYMFALAFLWMDPDQAVVLLGLLRAAGLTFSLTSIHFGLEAINRFAIDPPSSAIRFIEILEGKEVLVDRVALASSSSELANKFRAFLLKGTPYQVQETMSSFVLSESGDVAELTTMEVEKIKGKWGKKEEKSECEDFMSDDGDFELNYDSVDD